MTTNLLDSLPKSLEFAKPELTKTLLPSIHLESKQTKLELWSSKFGGVPYWESACQEEFPSDEYGNWMILLTQINFAECNGDGFLPSFPKSGILQFFISPELETVSGSLKSEEWVDGDPNNYYLKFWNDVKKGEFLESLQSFEEIFEEIDNDENINFISPFDFSNRRKVFREGFGITFKKFLEPINISDNSFELKILNNNKEYWNIYDTYTESFQKKKKIGGYPFFWQIDHREKDKKRNLLLQFDPADSIGLAKFFIDQKNLLEFSFSDIFYDVEV